MIELLVFLGNPGVEYAETRHNAGRLLAAWAFPELGWRPAYKGLFAAAGRYRFLMPETYMNCSGESVRLAASFFKIPPEGILVVHDDLELSFGQGGIKFSGGLGGHKGLRSIRGALGVPDFWRFRIGIGRPNHRDIAGWVLSPFSLEERPGLEQVLRASGEALALLLEGGPESLLPEWNKKNLL
jgi:PTH1 family peptidyl-tRNA hydrolase